MADDIDRLHTRYQATAARLAGLGFAVPGSLVRRYTYCGKPGCRCQADPPRPHGPYYQLTRKVAGKTITRRLTSDQAARYAEWIANQRELRRLVAEMEAISGQATELILRKDTTNTRKLREIKPPNAGSAPPHPAKPAGQRVLSLTR